VTWQPGRTVKRTVQPRGLIRRISAAVLVDQTVRWEGSGAKMRKVLLPPSAEMMKGIRDVVAGVTGLNEQRGDAITVESLPFENTVAAEPPSAAIEGPASKQKLPLSWKQPPLIAGIVLGMGALGFFGWMMMSRKKKKAAEAVLRAELAAAQKAKISPSAEAQKQLEKQLTDNETQQAMFETEALSKIKLPLNSRKTEVLVKHIRDTSHKDPASTANVLRTWISDGDGRRA
jgi:flagellar M-ring protein FliF